MNTSVDFDVSFGSAGPFTSGPIAFDTGLNPHMLQLMVPKTGSENSAEKIQWVLSLG